jgi:tetratricopeptide (TPR) repeat protein
MVGLCILLVFSCATTSSRVNRAERLYEEGQVLASRGKLDEALTKFQESLSLAKEENFQAGVAHNLNEMAILHTTQGEYDKARERLTQALVIYKGLKMNTETSKALNNFSLTYVKEGNSRAALSSYETLLDWDRQTNNRLGEAITRNSMGLIYELNLREYGEAQEQYARALEILEKIGSKARAEAVRKNLTRVLLEGTAKD